jgi:RHS repeat-associated protein
VRSFLAIAPHSPNRHTFTLGLKRYEITNHLGNILATISDRKSAILAEGTFLHWQAEVISTSDYYPFGSTMPGREYSSSGYRYGFNGKENDREWGKNTIQDYGFRLYNPALGKFLSVDPLTKEYPSWTPYAFAMNRVIDGVDLDGLEFLSSEDALIEFKGGELKIKLENTSSGYQRNYHQRNANSMNWSRDQYGERNIGISLTIADVDFTKIAIQEKKLGLGEVPDESMPKILKGHANGVKNTTANGGTPKSGIISSSPNSSAYNRASRVSGVLNLIQDTEAYLSRVSINLDNIEINKQADIEARNTMVLMNQALKDGMIPAEFAKASSLETIANVVLSGNSNGDKQLYNLGMSIFNKYTKPLIFSPSEQSIDSGWGLDRSSPLPKSTPNYTPNPDYINNLKKR